MPMDEYDIISNHKYAKTINIYKKDYNNVDIITKNFFKNFEQTSIIKDLEKLMNKLINNLINGLNILENRNIVCISGRIINPSNTILETYLINVWR